MKLFSIIFIALVAVASALPVSDDLELPDLLTDDSNAVSDLQASVLDAQRASEHQASKAMAAIVLHQNEHPMSKSMAKVLLQQNEQKSSKAMAKVLLHQSPEKSLFAPTNDVSLSVGNGYVRANADLSQYSFSSCHGGDAPGQGHCRPQIDSPQVRFCFACGPCVERQCMWRLLPSRAGRRSLSKVVGCPLTSRLRRALPVCFYRAVAAAAAAIRFEAQ
jgi:hypothetical protein